MKFIAFVILTLVNVLAFDLRGSHSAAEIMFSKGKVAAHRFSYQVCISFQQSFFESSLCSGSLIGNEWILTAAHCAMNATNATIYLGAFTNTAAEIIYTVTKDNIVIHPNWNNITGSNDISLIKIPYTTYSAKIQPVKLPSASSFYLNYDGDSALATGWQHESNSFSSSKSTLKWTSLQISPRRVCTKSSGVRMAFNTICAVTQQKVSACSVDSGGPLVLEVSKVQIGLNSLTARSNCSGTYSAAFTRIVDYLDWIKSYTGISY